MTNLSENFTLEELIKSGTAIRLGIPNQPGESEIASLKELVKNVLQPLRSHFNLPVVISSGYRSPALNTQIGGSINSQHMKGQAADLTIPSISLRDIYAFISQNLDYDQLIYEFDSWIHVSYISENRKQNLVAEKVNGKTVYRNFT